MNPLDFSGPTFLAFYALYGAAICVALFAVRQSREPRTPTAAVPTDAQTIAYLRGGATEALRISAVTLLEHAAFCNACGTAVRVQAKSHQPKVPATAGRGAPTEESIVPGFDSPVAGETSAAGPEAGPAPDSTAVETVQRDQFYDDEEGRP